MKVIPKPGDYVSTNGISYDEYKKIVELFVSLGADQNGHPSMHFGEKRFFGWGFNNRIGSFNDNFHYGANPNQLYVSDLLGSGPEQWMPKINDECEYSALSADNWSKIIPRFINNHVCVFDTGNGEGDSYLRVDNFQFRPIKSERYIAVEDMHAIIERAKAEYSDVPSALYAAGYRKVKP